MALSRTARILIAILLLAAAAFFWVNYFTQSRLAETPAQDPLAAAPAPTAPAAAPAAPVDDAEAEVDAVVEPDAEVVVEPDSEITGAAPTDPTDADTEPAPVSDADASTPAPDAGVADPDAPPVVVVDAPVAVTREVVIADLPFLITSPQELAPDEAAEAETETPTGITVPTRATVNPFSPVVVRMPPAPERDVPAPSVVVGEVAIPAGPPAVAPAPVRASAPTPRAVAPAAPAPAGLTRELPTGAVLASTPDLLREARVGTVADRVDLPSVTAVAIPAPEPTVTPQPADPRPASPEVVLEPVGASADRAGVAAEAGAPDAGEPTAGSAATGVATGSPPLVAGSTRLARYLRDFNYTFTGSVLGPVSVGVFRSQLEPVPIVVALGQTLPNTDIVLTDLRGMQAELTLGDTTQILTLDLRR